MKVWSEWDVLKRAALLKFGPNILWQTLFKPKLKQFNQNNMDWLCLAQLVLHGLGGSYSNWAKMCSLLVSRPSIFLLSPIVSFSLRASAEQLGRGSCGPRVGPGRLLKYRIFRAWSTTDNSNKGITCWCAMSPYTFLYTKVYGKYLQELYLGRRRKKYQYIRIQMNLSHDMKNNMLCYA